LSIAVTSVSSHAPAQPAQSKRFHPPAVSDVDARASRIFVHAILIGAICLQRFGLALGKGTALFAALPITTAMIGWLLWTHRAKISTPLLIGYVAFLTAVAVSTTLAFAHKDNQVLSISLMSPFAIILNYLPLISAPNQRFDRSCVLPIFIKYARFCTSLGIIQYLAQFVGIRFFSFYLTFPFLRPILIEQQYNYDPATAYGSIIRRANGVFCIEPALFSQLIVIAACIEFFIFKRSKFLPVYAIAYMFTYSGTGALSFLIAVPLYIILFSKEASRLALLGALGVIMLGSGALLFPNEFNGLFGRSTEISQTGSSGYHRYVGQFGLVDTLIGQPRILVGFGPGSLERSTFSQTGTTGPIAKLIVEYGVGGLIAFMLTLVAGIWRRDLAIIPLLMLSIFLFGGGNFAFSPLLAEIFLLCIWAAPPAHKLDRGLVGAQTQPH